MVLAEIGWRRPGQATPDTEKNAREKPKEAHRLKAIYVRAITEALGSGSRAADQANQVAAAWAQASALLKSVSHAW